MNKQTNKTNIHIHFRRINKLTKSLVEKQTTQQTNTCLDKATNNTRKMPELITYKNFFNKSEKERTIVQEKQNSFILDQDRKVANYLGTSETYLIAIIRNVLQHYDYTQHKTTRDQSLEEEEKILIDYTSNTAMQLDDTNQKHHQKSNTRLKLNLLV